LRRMYREGDPGLGRDVVRALPDRHSQDLSRRKRKHLSAVQDCLRAAQFTFRVLGRMPGLRSGESGFGGAMCAVQGEHPVGHASGVRPVSRPLATVGEQQDVSWLRCDRGRGGLRGGICHHRHQWAAQVVHWLLAGRVRDTGYPWPIHLGHRQEIASIQVTPGEQE